MLRKVVYQYWTGSDMPPARKACFDATRDVFGVPVELVTDDTLADYVVPGHPLHPCFAHLSLVHKADYVRCYLMRFHGGGWADIKRYSSNNNWAESFDVLDRTPGADVLGSPENVRGLAFRPWHDAAHASKSLICGWFIAKSDTPFVVSWYSSMLKWLDMMRPEIEANPGTGTYGVRPGTYHVPQGAPYVPGYPLPYGSVLGWHFHYACVKAGDIRPGSVLRSLRSGIVMAPYR